MSHRDIFPYRLLALDADGTILTADQQVRPAVRAAIRAAQERGVVVVLATGRAFRGAQAIARDVGLTAPVICYQGAVVQDPLSEEVLLSETYPRTLIYELLDWTEPRRLDVTVYVDGFMYLKELRHPPEFYDRWFGIPMRLVPDLRASLPDDPTKFLLIAESETCDRVLPELRALFAGRLEVFRSHDLFVEGTAPGVSKGSALAYLAARYGIPREQVIAVGDAGNDLEMLRWAGLGVAMGNAAPEVQAMADWVAPPIMADGVAEVIRRFILSPSPDGHADVARG
jgi:Cof subfamily protein (haloacid dehalogenase superfamily)